MKIKPRSNLLKIMKTFFPRLYFDKFSQIFPQLLFDEYLPVFSSPPGLSGQDPTKLPKGHWRNYRLLCSSITVIIHAAQSMPWDHPWSCPFALAWVCISSFEEGKEQDLLNYCSEWVKLIKDMFYERLQ